MIGLQAQWRGRRRFTVLATGFGSGTRFLETWAAWRNDAERPDGLHFIAIEPAPLTVEALASHERDPALRSLAAELVAAWPPPTSNLHRLSFDGGAVQLWLGLGGVEAWLPQLAAEVDAFFLDDAGPVGWTPRLFKAMARLAAEGATVVARSTVPALRRGLASAGFDVSSAAGATDGSDVTQAVYAPRFVPRTASRRTASTGHRQDDDPREPVLVIGAGLAGCAVAHALAELGRDSIVFERHRRIAEEASGNAAGLFHGVVHEIDGQHARFFRAAALAARSEVAAAIADGVAGSTDGLLRLEPAARDERAIAETIERLRLPPDYVRALGSEAASALAGVALQSPAWFYPGGGWVAPRELCAWWLGRAGSRAVLRTGCKVAGLRWQGDRWRLLDAEGQSLAEAGTVVLAHAGGELAVEGMAPWPLARSRGQLSSLDAATSGVTRWPRLPLAGAGYVLPPIAGRVWFGASTRRGDDDVTARQVDRAYNLKRLGLQLPDLHASNCPGGLEEDRVAFRYGTADRLPLIGAVPDAAAAEAGAAGDRVHRMPRLPGLFVLAALGSRGIGAAAIGGRAVAALITGTPAPLEADLREATDPARFLVRAARRERSRAAAGEDAAQPPVGLAAGSAGAS